MANLNLDSLPPSIIHKILSKVATNNPRDFCSARIAFSRFNKIGKEDHFYRSANLMYLNDWIDEVNAVRKLRLMCYQLGNPEAIYLRGMYEFFRLHLLVEGREKIHLAAERRFSLAKYVDGMTNLVFSVDDRVLVHKYPSFTREYVDRMHHMMTSWALICFPGCIKPEMFRSLCERISLNVSRDCWCSTIIEPVFEVSIDESRKRWRCDRCFWQRAAWGFGSDIHLTARHRPIGD